MKYLIISVDTESDWYDQKMNSLKSIEGLEFLQEECSKYGMKPTYLVTHEIATRDEAIKVIKKYLDMNQCEVGSHLHVWSTPPFENENPQGVDENWIGGLQSELPDSIFEEKMQNLDDAIRKNYGIRPTAHRAGRWAVDKRTIEYLGKNEYLVDSSICPYLDYTTTKGVNEYNTTNSYNAPNIPYYPDAADITKNCAATESVRSILEVPVTGIKGDFLNRINIRGIVKLRSFLYKFGYSGSINMSFRPSQTDIPFKAFQSITHKIFESDIPVVNLMFHSSELTLGTSPYSKDAELLDLLKNKIKYVLKKTEEYNIKGICLSEVTKCQNIIMTCPS